MYYQFDFLFFMKLVLISCKYIPITLYIAVTTLLIGLALGTLLAMAVSSRLKVLSYGAKGYILVVRGIPTVLLLIILYNLISRSVDALSSAYNLPFNSGHIPRTMMAILALSLSSMAFMAESIRAGLQSVHPGQVEASLSVGMTKSAVMRRIVIPQALPVVIPIVGNNFIGLLKATALVNIVGVTEILQASVIASNLNYRFLEAYLAAALVYWLMTIGVEKLVKRLTGLFARRSGMEGSV